MMTIYGRVISWPSLYMRMISHEPIGDYRTTFLIGTVYTKIKDILRADT